MAVLLSACGGGTDSTLTSQANTYAGNGVTTGVSAGGTAPPTANRTIMGAQAAAAAADPAATARLAYEAAHFLGQASFGVSISSMQSVVSSGKPAWIDAQFLKPQVRHADYVKQFGTGASIGNLYESFWKQVTYGDDQLRQRVAFALSQIFVISTIDGNIYNHPAGAADYYDTLGQHAFGNFRNLLQAVALHPMMGLYLSHMRNQKESGTRMPDENFAREIMQLMSIGLYQLNPDGTVKTANGKPIETYTRADVTGLAKVFTGWSWAGPDQSSQRFLGGKIDAARDWTPMQMYPAYHSTSAKSFLGTSIGGGTSGEADLKVALDTLFNHPNVGPFIGRQLIQRLVSSNPSQGYVYRVAAAFANNGAGVRGDMRAVIRAVLLDSEAVDNGSSKKLREPMLRLGNWLRAFNASSTSGRFQIGALDDALGGLGQTLLRAPSVFNYFRPQYSPPNTALSAAGKVAPEMQITSEPSVTGYLNFMQSIILSGLGPNRDVQANYSGEIALAAKPEELVDRLKLLLLGGAISTTLRNQVISAVNAVALPAPTAGNASVVDEARRNRVRMAIYLVMASPEYVAQR